jgi:hypothetical protein
MTTVIACDIRKTIGKKASSKADIYHPLKKAKNSPEKHIAIES